MMAMMTRQTTIPIRALMPSFSAGPPLDPDAPLAGEVGSLGPPAVALLLLLLVDEVVVVDFEVEVLLEESLGTLTVIEVVVN